MPELVYSAEDEPALEQRITRLLSDVRMLQTLPRAQIKTVAPDLEEVRDRLSDILNRLGGKR